MVVLFYSFDEMNEQFTKIYNKFQIAAQVYPNINFVKADIDTDLARMMQVLQTP